MQMIYCARRIHWLYKSLGETMKMKRKKPILRQWMKIECHLGHTCTLHKHTARLLLKTSYSPHYICTNYSDKLNKTSLQSVETGEKSVGFIAAAVHSHKLHVNEKENGRKVSIMQLTCWWNFSRAPVLVLHALMYAPCNIRQAATSLNSAKERNVGDTEQLMRMRRCVTGNEPKNSR